MTTTVVPRRQFPATLALTLLCLLLSASLASAEYISTCHLVFTFSNANRHVYGPVNAECTYGCPPASHSHKWGNWGVDSNYTGRWDGEQFRGWQTNDTFCGGLMYPPQWNSCTSGSTPGFAGDYNFAGNTQQWSPDERDYAGVSWHSIVNDQTGCQALNGQTFNFDGSFMRLYELDWNHDSFIAQLDFPSLAITMNCPDLDRCDTTYSGWQGSYSNSTGRADIRVRVFGVYEVVWVD